jgi:hypothetical protein
MEDAVTRGKPQGGVDHDARGVVAGYEPGRKLRIVALDRRCPDDDRVGQGPKAVHVLDVLGARHVARSAARGGDLRVEALSHVPEHHPPACLAEAQGEVEIEHLGDRGDDAGRRSENGIARRIDRNEPHFGGDVAQAASAVEHQAARAPDRLTRARALRECPYERPRARFIERLA